MGMERGIQQMMPHAIAPRSHGLGAARTGGGVAVGGGLGGLPVGWEGLTAQSSPFSTSAQPLGSFPPCLRASSSFQPLNDPQSHRRGKHKGARAEAGRWIGWMDAHFGLSGRASQSHLAGPGCSWALTPGSRVWPGAQCLLSIFYCSGASSGWDLAAATSPGSYPQQGGQEEERSHKMQNMP